MPDLYPIQFVPQFKEKIWGGRKLEEFLGKTLSDKKDYGESWEISEVENNVSVVSNGAYRNKDLSELIDFLGPDLLGEKVIERFGKHFPLLVKFLDAQRDLSIQVHPDDKLARSKSLENGKTEMWYIIDTENDPFLYRGFNKKIDKKEFQKRIEKNTIEEVLKKEAVHTDDIFYIPAGTVHNIGKGILLAEIQQNSDATYRVYDFNRKDSDGNTRELHIEDALDAINFQVEKNEKHRKDRIINEPVELVKSDYFRTSRLSINQSYDFNYETADSFRILICIHGNGVIRGNFEEIEFKIGDTFLIPAALQKFKIETPVTVELLECQIP